MSRWEGLERAAAILGQRAGMGDRRREVSVVDLGRPGDDPPTDVIAAAYVSLVCDSTIDVGSDQESMLRQRMSRLGVTPEFTGTFKNVDGSVRPVAICRGTTPPPMETAPEGFKVVAIVPAYNEEDIIESTIGHLIANGLGVYLIDNWSTDGTLARALAFEGHGLIGHERFPVGGPSKAYELQAMKEREEALVESLEADWIVSNDADEFRSSPWEGVSLRDAIYHVHRAGYSTVDYTSLNFALTSDTFVEGEDISRHLEWFAIEPGSLHRLNTWRKPDGARAELAWSGGHTVRFPGLNVFPYNFLIRHYPLRSRTQASRKVFKERLPRFPVEERLLGWHSHYDSVKKQELLQPTTGLTRYDAGFAQTFLLERLTGLPPGGSSGKRSLKMSIARTLKRAGLLEHALRIRWRTTGRAAR